MVWREDTGAQVQVSSCITNRELRADLHVEDCARRKLNFPYDITTGGSNLDIGKGEVGAEGAYNIKLEKGKIAIEIEHAHASGTMAVKIVEDVPYFLDKLKKAIPGPIDDAIFEALKLALRMI